LTSRLDKWPASYWGKWTVVPQFMRHWRKRQRTPISARNPGCKIALPTEPFRLRFLYVLILCVLLHYMNRSNGNSFRLAMSQVCASELNLRKHYKNTDHVTVSWPGGGVSARPLPPLRVQQRWLFSIKWSGSVARGSVVLSLGSRTTLRNMWRMLTGKRWEHGSSRERKLRLVRSGIWTRVPENRGKRLVSGTDVNLPDYKLSHPTKQ
jgi:hypothetical protein